MSPVEKSGKKAYARRFVVKYIIVYFLLTFVLLIIPLAILMHLKSNGTLWVIFSVVYAPLILIFDAILLARFLEKKFLREISRACR